MYFRSVIESADIALRQKPRQGAVVASAVSVTSQVHQPKEHGYVREPKEHREAPVREHSRDYREPSRESREKEHMRMKSESGRVHSERSRGHEESVKPRNIDIYRSEKPSAVVKSGRKVYVDRMSSMETDSGSSRRYEEPAPVSDKRRVSQSSSMAMQVTIKSKSKETIESDERKVITDPSKTRDERRADKEDLREKLKRRGDKKGDDLRERILRKDGGDAARAFDRKVSVIDEDKFEPDYDESSEPENEKPMVKQISVASAVPSQGDSDSDASSTDSDRDAKKKKDKKKKKHKKHKHKDKKRKHKKHKKDDRD